MVDLKARLTPFLGLLSVAILSAALFEGCSSSGDSTPNPGAGGTTSTSDGKSVVGNFKVGLNPAVGTLAAYTSIIGKAYSGPVLTPVIETPIKSNSECAVYAYDQQSCIPACSTTQTCVATNTCKDNPTVVAVGDVSVAGIGSTTLKLTGVSGNYQYPLDITYPGFAEGDTITLSATGDHYPAFSATAKGVAPLELSATSYTIDTGTALDIKWTAGSSAVGAKVNIGLNISKHGGSAGYLSCDVSDTGSYTIPADLITALINLGVAGFPQLTMTRATKGEAPVSTGVIEFVVEAVAIPNLQVKGYCSCFNSAECGSCADTTKTVCDTVKKLCNAP
jgi:hypothetical protein